ncbi:hypothetical protein [Sphingobacterium multivorum]|uniref:Uncharacterized protein n=1 Tax=Sphingobacterium multivorum TaxID=28454 RepID=A0A654D343_SPHMU|nr:hypothetical protein [Sphingobacterium multivorum]VXC99316.1 conserved hypothetical protein [Sphingobacterium multivorum]
MAASEEDKVRFPSGMGQATSVKGGDKIMLADADTGETKVADFDQAKTYLSISSIEMKPVPAGALPAGPTGQTRTMEILEAGTWTFGGNSFVNPSGSIMKLWWDGTTWSLGSSVPLPNGQGLLPLWDSSKVGGYLKDAQVRDPDGITYVSLKDGNTSALSVEGDWLIQKVEVKDFLDYNLSKAVSAKAVIDLVGGTNLVQNGFFEDRTLHWVGNGEGETVGYSDDDGALELNLTSANGGAMLQMLNLPSGNYRMALSYKVNKTSDLAIGFDSGTKRVRLVKNADFQRLEIDFSISDISFILLQNQFNESFVLLLKYITVINLDGDDIISSSFKNKKDLKRLSDDVGNIQKSSLLVNSEFIASSNGWFAQNSKITGVIDDGRQTLLFQSLNNGNAAFYQQLSEEIPAGTYIVEVVAKTAFQSGNNVMTFSNVHTNTRVNMKGDTGWNIYYFTMETSSPWDTFIVTSDSGDQSYFFDSIKVWEKDSDLKSVVYSLNKTEGGVTNIGEVEAIADRRIAQQVPNIVDNHIGTSLNQYLVEHIGDFSFNQPNYIQANSNFDFLSLSSQMNGKFINIIEDINLGGKTVDFVALGVEGLNIVFNGGRIINGAIRPNNTLCVFNSIRAFNAVEILGKFRNEYAHPEWFGAKCDGVDGGVGDFSFDDSFAWNQALRFSNLVRGVGSRTSIVKKPVYVNSGNHILLDPDFTVRLGDASNCTMLKNKHVDYLNTGLVGGVTYPANFRRDRNITIEGGIWDGNGRKQNRASSVILGDQPDVINTPIFSDPDGVPYQGWAMKFADIDNFRMKNVILKDSRTYSLAAGGITHGRFNDITFVRGYKFENNDGLHIHGSCYDIEFDNIVGVGGDDLIAITTHESDYRSIRVGDVKKIRMTNLYNYGFLNENPETPTYITDGIPPDNVVYRPIRLTYTQHTIDDVYISNLQAPRSFFNSAVVCSYLPHNDVPNTGRIGRVTIADVSIQGAVIGVDIAADTTLDFLRLTNLTMITSEPLKGAIIAPDELWTGNQDDFKKSKVDTIMIDNVYVKRHASDQSVERALFYQEGTIENLIINNLVVADTGLAAKSHRCLIKGGNIRNLKISNSKIDVDKLFELSNPGIMSFSGSNNEFNYCENGIYIRPSSVGNIPARINCTDFIVNSNPASPKFGDKILKSDGEYMYTTSWNKL